MLLQRVHFSIDSSVKDIDHPVTAASSEHVVVTPSETSDPLLVYLFWRKQFTNIWVPNLHVAIRRSNSKLFAVSGPLNGRDCLVYTEVIQLIDDSIPSIPEIESRSEPNNQLVLQRPVKQVAVKVIFKSRSVKDFVSFIRDNALFFQRYNFRKLIFIETS